MIVVYEKLKNWGVDMYNVGAVYEIVGRVVNGTCVSGYLLRDKRDNSVSIVKKSIVEQLALNKQIYNCSAQIYNTIVNLKGINCRLSALPKYNDKGQPIQESPSASPAKKAGDLKLIGKIQQGREVKAYIVCSVSDADKKMTISRDKVLVLAQSGRIVNAKSQRNGNTLVLRGDNGFNLSQLKVYNE